MHNQQYQQAILSVIKEIPAGKVTTYGDIAKRAGLPGYARHVGQLLKNLPESTTLPWHRIINAQGRISFPTLGEQYQAQKLKLIEEGISLSSSDKIDLQQYRW